MVKVPKETQKIIVLNEVELQEAYSVPKIPIEYKDTVFEIDNLNEIENYDISVKVKYILDLGYFKVKKTFFSYEFSEVLDDVVFVLKKYFPYIKTSEIKKRQPRKDSINTLRRLILTKFKYKYYNPEFDEIIIKKLKESYFKHNLAPKQLFDKIVNDILKDEKLTLPEYRRMQIIISKIINTSEKEIFTKLMNKLEDKNIEEINKILGLKAKKESVLTFLKTSARGFAHNAVKEEIRKRKHMIDVYNLSKEILKELNISYTTIQYYAKLVSSLEYSQINNGWNESKKYFAILCFVNYRFVKSNDDMVKTFKYLVNHYSRKVYTEYKEYLFKNRKKNKELFKKIQELLGFLFETDTWKSYTMETLRDKIFEILEIGGEYEGIEEIKELIDKQFLRDVKVRWEIMDKLYKAIKKNIKPVLSQMNLTYSEEIINNKTKNVIKFYQNFHDSLKDKNVKFDWNDMPKHLIPQSEFAELENKPKRIEIYMYSKINDWLERNEVYVEESIEFKKFEDYLMSWDEYEKENKQIFEEIESEFLQKPFEQSITRELNVIDKKFHVVNQMISKNEIEHFKMISKDKWTLEYEKIEEIETPAYFKEFETDIVSLIRLVDKKTNFLSSFEHISLKNVSREIDKDRLISGILMNATGLEYKNFENDYPQSKNKINYKKLNNYLRTRIRNETLDEAHRIINIFASKLPSFRRYDIDLGFIHSGSDGQKIGSKHELNIVRHSQKFWGKGKAVNHLTMQVNYLFASMLVIPANEYEGNSLLELILKSNLEDKPKRHSTDNHGINDLNFGLLELFGYQFCPRYKTVSKRTKTMVSGILPKFFPEDYVITPSYRLDSSWIVNYEKEIRRIIASIWKNKDSATIIVRRILGMDKENKLRKAFVHFNRLIMTNYILNYVIDLKLRQSIQAVQNRSEYLNALKSEIRFANKGILKGKSEEEVSIILNSAMLVCSAIIYYNCLVLDTLVEKGAIKDQEELENLAHVSPYSWSHIIIHGKYDFGLDGVKQIEEKLKV